MNNIDDLLEKLFEKKIHVNGYASNYHTEAIHKEARPIVESIIRQFIVENRDKDLGILQAKVYAYEQIIAKSNFAMVLEVNND